MKDTALMADSSQNPENAPPPMPDDNPGWSGRKTVFMLMCAVVIPILLLVIFNDSVIVKGIGFLLIVALLRFVSRMGRSFRDL